MKQGTWRRRRIDAPLDAELRRAILPGSDLERMPRTRHILVLTLVATVLCADHVAVAAPQAMRAPAPTADPIARLASNLASRLTGTFRRERENSTVVRLQSSTRQVAIVQQPVERIIPEPLVLHQVEGSPFQFRLPPPQL
jgi:hypothetical protein